MNILFIAPVPPPLAGHSLVSGVLFSELSKEHNVFLVNLNKYSLVDGEVSFNRILVIAYLLLKIIFYIPKSEVVYLTISESVAGNLKDLCIFLICIFKLKNICIHLHGGSIKNDVFDKYKLLMNINNFFYKRIGKIIISGESHKHIFHNFESKIYIIKNFSEDEFFIDDSKLFNKLKLTDNSRINILFLSNLVEKKGFIDLIDAVKILYNLGFTNVHLTIAGRVDSAFNRNIILSSIVNYPNIEYLGEVNSVIKKKILNNSNIFCLPTKFLEGQPISIIEAYASGCVVLTTHKPGISDIFTNTINGFYIEEGNPGSIVEAVIYCINNKQILSSISKQNLIFAKNNFTKNRYIKNINKILLNISS